MKFARIVNGVIETIILATQEYVDTLQGEYVLIDGVFPQPQIGWAYDKNVFSQPAVNLNQVKAAKIAEFREALFTYRDSKFDSNTRESFVAIYLDAKFNLNLNRLGYLQPLLDWRLAIIQYGVTFVNEISAMATVDEVNAATWDFQNTDNIPATPNVTLYGALSL